MDVLYQLGVLNFTWDIQKAAANQAKHGVRFETACEAFFDPLLRFFDASLEDDAREALVGKTAEGALLFVVHIEREGHMIRLISARAATSKERSVYEEYA